MKKIALFVAALTLSASASVAFADSVSLASGPGTVSYLGYKAGVAPFNASDPLASGFSSSNAPAATQTINMSGEAGPIPGSTWVSFNNSGTGGTVDANGYYTYSTKFTAVGVGNYSASLNLLADDTVAVYLNGVLEVPAGVIGDDNHCSVGQPNCSDVFTKNFITALNGGVNGNTLLFVVEQTKVAAQGLDFTASFNSINPTPEPSSLIMLGTGLVSGAGALMRRRRTV